MSLLEIGIAAVEHGLVPDGLTRSVVRSLCRDRLRQLRGRSGSVPDASAAAFRESLHSGPIAPVPHEANRQHYELPPEFFATVLGPRRKYSCCYFPTPSTTLAAAEEASLAETCQRADLADGQDILDLGCGWGALCLWIAERYPHSQITAVSNSAGQRRFIEHQAAARGYRRLRVVTADMNDYLPRMQTFDRIVSVEMFEHMRNYRRLLARIASWLRPEGKLFVHYFCHRDASYPFETEGAANWMGRHFFSGGIMPSATLLQQFDDLLVVTRHDCWSGLHYRRTAEAWLANLDARRDDAQRILAGVYGPPLADRWFQRWRMFFLAVAELFGFAQGQEWFVSHCLLEKAGA